MWPFGKGSFRRRELRRGYNGHLGQAAAQLLRRDIIVPSIVLGLLAVSACLVILYGETGLPYRVGQRMDRPIVARVDFTWDNPIKAAREQDIARRGTPNYYRLNSELIAEAERDVQGLTDALAHSESYGDFRGRMKEAVKAAGARGSRGRGRRGISA